MQKKTDSGGNGNGTSNGSENRLIYYYKGTLSFDNLHLGSDQNPAYLFVEVKEGTDNISSTYFATGVFKELPTSLKLDLPNDTDFIVNVKVVKKGGSYGILRYLNGNHTIINWANTVDSLDYQLPMENSAGDGGCWVYTKPDSSEYTWEQYPQTDTYFAQLVFNTGKVTDSLKINLGRMVWGLKCSIHNFKKGTIKLLVGDIQSPANPVGTSEQTLNYPVSTKLFIHSYPVLYQTINQSPRLRVIYNNTVQDQTIYDNSIHANLLRKTILDIDLESPIKFQVLPDSILTEQEISKIK